MTISTAKRNSRLATTLMLSAGTACTAFMHASTPAGPGKPAEDRPNILWLTFEDASWYLFGCYGNNQVHTPVMDSLASEGVLFSNAWASAPQSSAARSSLITGCYAPTYGMDIHPCPFDTPGDIFFPQLLREAGYYCTNNQKTHYNTTRDHKSCWDECDKSASYNSKRRAVNQPFFSVFNCTASHMGRYRTFHTDGRRDYTKEGIFPALLTLPPHLPDLPQVRSDYAANLEAIQDIDTWIGFFLRDLREKGLADNTIVFVFSDHGGCQPRGKGYLFETGLRVPLVAYIPPKYRDLYSGPAGGIDGRLVNFVDLGPTVLSLAGIKPPRNMHGRAFMGRYRNNAEKTADFAFTANQLHHYSPVRAVRDNRRKYIRSYIPYRQEALRNYYQWGMPANKAWDEAVLLGRITDPVLLAPYRSHGAERLYDIENDIYELKDLSQDAPEAENLHILSSALSEHIRQTSDLGFFLPSSREGVNLYQKVRAERFPLDRLYELVERAGTAGIGDYLYLGDNLGSDCPEFRFWACVGMAVLAKGGHLSKAPDILAERLSDSNPYVAAEAAIACAYADRAEEAVKTLVLGGCPASRKVYLSALECLALDPAMAGYILPWREKLEADAETLPRTENEDEGLMVRGILADLGCLSVWDIHGPESYGAGMKLNHGRRKSVPLP